jgi:hypothetical protein
MPTFDTPGPVSATIDVIAGDVRISAGDRDDTVVEVRPSDASNADDVKAAQMTQVHHANDHVVVKAPRSRSWLGRGGSGSIDVSVELPAGSHVYGTTHTADIACDGALGTCRIKTGTGAVRLERAATVSVKSGTGDVSVEHATGPAEVATATGDVRLGAVDGSAVIKSSTGDTWVGTAGGDLSARTAKGSIAVDHARASVGAKSARGDLRVGEAVRGSVVLQTHAGDVEVGVPEGTAAYLAVRAAAGTVRNELEAADGPEPSAETVEVRAHTSAGSVVIRRP